jgi:hypothetical protein
MALSMWARIPVFGAIGPIIGRVIWNVPMQTGHLKADLCALYEHSPASYTIPSCVCQSTWKSINQIARKIVFTARLRMPWRALISTNYMFSQATQAYLIFLTGAWIDERASLSN